MLDSAFRFDLNGDGFVDEVGTARIDLNADGSYGTLSVNVETATLEIDENAVTDQQVLCYYAFSDLYTGDQLVRAELMTAVHAEGPFVEIVSLPERFEPDVPFDVVIRAGLRTPSGPQVVEGAAVSIHVDGGQVEPDEGFTDASGLFTVTVTPEDDENVLIVEADADLGLDEEAETTGSVLRVNSVEIVARYVYIDAGVFASYQQDFGIPSVRFIEEWDFREFAETFEAVDEDMAAQGSGSAAGMQVSGDAASSVLSNLDLGSGTDFFGATIRATTSGTITLQNPNTQISHYQADAAAFVDVTIEFNVWGEPAPYVLRGTVSGQYYDIEIDGDEDVFECDYSDSPCSTISNGGLLPPGNYDLCASIDVSSFIHDREGTPQQGTVSGDGEFDLTFSINHNGI